MKLKNIIFAILLLTIPYSLATSHSFAQQVSLSISPPLLEVFIKPGKSIMVAYSLENSGDPTIIEAEVVSFEPKDNLGQISLKSTLEGPVRFYLDNADLQLNQSFFLKTGEKQQLLLRIRVPDGAPEGDYYYSLLAKTVPPPTLEGVASSRAKATIASNILITVTESGIVEVKPKIAIFEILSRFKLNLFGKVVKIFDSFDKVPLMLIVENKGNNLIKPEGKISLRGNFGETSTHEIIPKNILAQSKRLMEARLPSPAGEANGGQATPSASINDGNSSLIFNGFFVGLYNLSTNITFGENSPTIFASSSFFAFPFKLLFGFIIVVTLTIYVIKKFSRNDD